jgi:hypothetical protein
MQRSNTKPMARKSKPKKGDRVTFTVTPKNKEMKPYSAVGVVKEVGQYNFGKHGMREGVKVEVRTKRFLQTHTNKVVTKLITNVKKK